MPDLNPKPVLLLIPNKPLTIGANGAPTTNSLYELDYKSFTLVIPEFGAPLYHLVDGKFVPLTPATPIDSEVTPKEDFPVSNG